MKDIRSGNSKWPSDTDDNTGECDGATSTSFSLEECMNEFRARRIRRISSHSRPEGENRSNGQKGHNTTDKDLINQNLSNKQQERKCKPCKDGFCYCFTSDSGDGSVGETMYRKYAQGSAKCAQINAKFDMPANAKTNKRNKIHLDTKLDNTQEQNELRVSNCPQISAVSRLETTGKDAPLIHIIQELRDNCVISEVRINKKKLNSSYRSYKPNCESFKKGNQEMHIKQNTVSSPILLESHQPSAPPLYSISRDDSYNKEKHNMEKRNKAGGRLLQKRLSNSNAKYKRRENNDPPPKPPRCSLSAEEKSSKSICSSSSSVREAERILDDFLVRRGYNRQILDNTSKNVKVDQPLSKQNANEQEKEKHKSHPLGTEDQLCHANQVLATYPSLIDLEDTIHSKHFSNNEKNIRKVEDNNIKSQRIGWNDSRIREMLSYELNTNDKMFRSTSTQAEPQKTVYSVGWHAPPKLEIDTVDGIARNNMASNIEIKNTPVKCEMAQGSNVKPKRVWSGHLRHFSPWSKKKNISHSGNAGFNSKKILKSSTRKILRLVSPKKDNKERVNIEIRKTPFRTVAVQTTEDDFSRLSPPGSYHSPIQSSLPQSLSCSESQNITTNENESGNINFDFSRHINSPPKKPIRSSQRKLNFPLNGSNSCIQDVIDNKEKKTYKSYNEELDHDVSLSKMGYILSNIRAKLEASDDQAIRIFREIDRAQQVNAPTVEIQTHIPHVKYDKEPIYSEIDDDSIHVSESPNVENHTGIQHFNVNDNPNVLYALVDKSNKNLKSHTTQQQHVASLGKILHDSLKSKRNAQQKPTLSPLPEPSGGELTSYSSPSLERQIIHYQSLNNVRVMEHNSPPKRQRNLSKSDLSLHRSEIFLENLCRSQVFVEKQNDCVDGKNLQKVENKSPEPSNVYCGQSSSQDLDLESDAYTNNHDAVSYEVPVDEQCAVNSSDSEDSSNGFNTLSPPSSENQSTPKKPTFTTKEENCAEMHQELEFDDHHSTSYTNTPMLMHQIKTPKNSRAYSLNVISDIKFNSISLGSSKLLPNLRSALNKSFRKSKNFVKRDTKKFPNSLTFKRSKSDELRPNIFKNASDCRDSTVGSDIDLDSLISASQDASINDQLLHVVNICRNMPESEIASEMVEAERLLLFSALRLESRGKYLNFHFDRTMDPPTIACVFIDDMYLPIREDPTRDIYFNYFYIVTFECGGIIRSTQSAECQNGVAIFRDCGMEFMLHTDRCGDIGREKIHCNIFMLRLRKVSCLTSEFNKKKLKEIKESASCTSSSSSLDIVSRFRLQASFNLDCNHFIPFDIVSHKSLKSDRIYLRSSQSCNVVLRSISSSSNLLEDIQVKGRAELRIPKIIHAGYLNFNDPNAQHSWNRRWCILDGIVLQVWRDENVLNESPILCLYLQHSKNELLPAPRELCARPRSFCVNCTIPGLTRDKTTKRIFFAADTQEDLREWLCNLNRTISLVNYWLN
ncbi:uncharacterized protein LOC133324613 [Musca vetustissima]|uniref:uncharacterized protein LOC133324613 n=1 Tax=Musca vetustissima TaxID=27455 RepID=UPI002AB6BF54|nr:uncharacterized protein LOC133324613 [Musca vetustissima]